ncbi:MAG: hypothetical protein R2867_12585 [Caldilineaceae bacterium]
MRTEKLAGSLEEQCAFLYRLAQEKIAQGNYTGAAHVLNEIVKHAPSFQDAAQLLQEVKQKKREQRNLLLFSLLGAALFIGVGTVTQVANDFLLLLLAVVGAVIGFGLGTIFVGRRKQRTI